jgi:hypothetical protein
MLRLAARLLAQHDDEREHPGGGVQQQHCSPSTMTSGNIQVAGYSSTATAASALITIATRSLQVPRMSVLAALATSATPTADSPAGVVTRWRRGRPCSRRQGFAPLDVRPGVGGAG